MNFARPGHRRAPAGGSPTVAEQAMQDWAFELVPAPAPGKKTRDAEAGRILFLVISPAIARDGLICRSGGSTLGRQA